MVLRMIIIDSSLIMLNRLPVGISKCCSELIQRRRIENIVVPVGMLIRDSRLYSKLHGLEADMHPIYDGCVATLTKITPVSKHRKSSTKALCTTPEADRLQRILVESNRIITRPK